MKIMRALAIFAGIFTVFFIAALAMIGAAVLLVLNGY